MELSEKAAKLRVYAELKGTEIGELCDSLISVAYSVDYASEEFKIALDKEITLQLENFQENSTIVQVERTHTRMVTTLEWN